MLPVFLSFSLAGWFHMGCKSAEQGIPLWCSGHHTSIYLELLKISHQKMGLIGWQQYRWRRKQLKVGLVCFPFIGFRIALYRPLNPCLYECEPPTLPNVLSEAGIKVWCSLLTTSLSKPTPTMLTVLPLVKARSSEKDVDKTMNIGEISEWVPFCRKKRVRTCVQRWWWNIIMSAPDEEDVDVECGKDGEGEGQEEEEDVADPVVQLVQRRLTLHAFLTIGYLWTSCWQTYWSIYGNKFQQRL